MIIDKKANREAVAKWRQSLKERGGKEVTMALDASALARLERLKKHFGVPAGEIVGFGLAILERQTQVFDIGPKKKGKGKGK